MQALSNDDKRDLEWFFTEAEAEIGLHSGQSLLQFQLTIGVVDQTGPAPEMMPARSERARRRAWKVHRTLAHVRDQEGGIAHVRILYWALGPVRHADRRRRLIAGLRQRFGSECRWEELLELMERSPMIEERRTKRQAKGGKPYDLFDAGQDVLYRARAYAQIQYSAASAAYALAAQRVREEEANIPKAAARVRRAFDAEIAAA